MMKRVLYLLAFLGFGWSCSDFLEEDAQNLTYVESISDLDEVLLGEGYMNTEMKELEEAAVPTWIHLLDDDVKFQYAATIMSDVAGGVHTWQASPCENTFLNQMPLADNTWKILYQRINALNIILYELKEYENEADHDRIKGEALFLRAGYYWWLVNIYAKAYDVRTADGDPGVPLKLTEYVEDYEERGGFTRASVAQVYKQIVKDLQASIQALKGYKRKSVYRASEYAARLLLSRVYLHMENYEGVVIECDSILKNSSYHLQDYNTIGANASLVTANSPEVLFSQGGNGLRWYCGCGTFGMSPGIDFEEDEVFMVSTYLASDELLNAFDDTEFFSDQSSLSDVRCVKGFVYGTYFDSMYQMIMLNGIPYKSGAWSNSLVSDRFTLRLAEVYLNMAEALASLGRDGEANQLLLTLRKHRLAYQEDNTVHQGEKLIRCNSCRTEIGIQF